LNGPQFLGNTLVESGLEQQDDIIQIPQGPGLGINMKPTAETYFSNTREI
jgi:L-alanine-DL-glutamate epimerase-like enolase superfamily enzyme